MANRAAMKGLAVGPDTVVTLSYVLFDEHGEVADEASASDPLQYVHGYAQIVPGLEQGLEGLYAGDQREIVVEPEDAFGEHEDEGVLEVDIADFPDAADIKPGDDFVAHGPDGEPMAMRVIEILPDAFRVDTNHPLAGQTVRFKVQVSDVRAASDEEIAAAQSDLEGRAGHDHAGCCGGHDHGHQGDPESAQQLLSLLKRPS